MIQREIMHFYENMPSTSSYVWYTSHQNTAQSINAARLYTTHSIQSLSGAKYLLWVAITFLAFFVFNMNICCAFDVLKYSAILNYEVSTIMLSTH